MTIWPNGAKAAVSFTYDDGRESQLDIAALDLEEFGFRGTFFITPKLYHVEQRAADWKRLALNNHEIGNHSMTHNRDYNSVEAFHLAELGPSEQWLNDHVLFDSNRIFAYPEGVTTLKNGMDYTSTLPGTVLAARTGGGGPVTAAMAKADQFRIPGGAWTWHAGNSSAKAIESVNKAAELDNGWSILIFHDVFEPEPNPDKDEDEAITSRRVHREIIKYVSDSGKFWVAPFREVLGKALYG
jgi:peptidoglycan/xylan/chitin deacetylase (PgdA/CDA1 family)